MVVAIYLLALLLHLVSERCDACRILTISTPQSTIEMIRMPLGKQSQLFNDQYVDSGRAIYESSEGFYLYHLQRPSSGMGWWVVSGTISDSVEDALYFKESWAVEPVLSDFTDNPTRSSWMSVSADNQAHSAQDLRLQCREASDTVFFEGSAALQPQLTGFYVARDVDETRSAVVYTLVKHNVQDKPTYLFHLPPAVDCAASVAVDAEPVEEQLVQQRCQQKTTWLVGDRYGVDAGLAYTSVTDEVPIGEQQLRVQPPPRDAEWRFVQPGEQPWAVDPSAALLSMQDPGAHGEDKSNIFELMQSTRSGQAGFPRSQRVKYLRNAVPVPQVGLGTGGVYLEDALDVFTDALSLGYRLFDLAREYGNEHVVPQALQRAQELLAAQCERPRKERDFPDACDSPTAGARPVQRGDLFLQSKVWPTELGYEPTSAAIATSLRLLQSTYVDLYMLHWPRCDASIDWMHCDTTVDPAATWRESWQALERAYAEGRVLSLGASNFNEELLEELRSGVATVLPHVVQNWAEPGQVDARVRAWCERHSVEYQPYAPLRNIQHLPLDVRQKLQLIAQRESVSEHSVVLQFFLQTGALVIPRSSSWEHLQRNIMNMSFQISSDDMRELGWK